MSLRTVSFDDIGFSLQPVKQNRGRGQGQGRRGRGRQRQGPGAYGRRNSYRGKNRGRGQGRGRGRRGRGRGKQYPRGPSPAVAMRQSGRMSTADSGYMGSVDLPSTQEIRILSARASSNTSTIFPPQSLTRSTFSVEKLSPMISANQKPKSKQKRQNQKNLARAAKWRQKQEEEVRRQMRASRAQQMAQARAGWNPLELRSRPSIEELMHAQIVRASIDQDRYKPVLLYPLKVKRLNSAAKEFVPRSQEDIEADEKRAEEYRKHKLLRFKKQEEQYQKNIAYTQRQTKSKQEKIKNTRSSLSISGESDRVRNSPARSPRNKKKRGKGKYKQRNNKKNIKNRNQLVN